MGKKQKDILSEAVQSELTRPGSFAPLLDTLEPVEAEDPRQYHLDLEAEGGQAIERTRTTQAQPEAKKEGKTDKKKEWKGKRTNSPVCIAIDEELVKKARVIAFRNSTPFVRCTLKEIVDKALEAYIAQYEGQNGPIIF